MRIINKIKAMIPGRRLVSKPAKQAYADKVQENRRKVQPGTFHDGSEG